MTSAELRIKFSDEFGVGKWPKTYKVDKETYGIICNDMLKYFMTIGALFTGESYLISISVGNNGGIMFKNVELIMDETL